MRYLHQALAYWPLFLLAALWLLVGLAALYYARTTRRPIFLFSGLAALALMVERLLSPARFLFHYLTTHAFYGGNNPSEVKIEFLFGAYKYEWLVDGAAALLLLLGVILEIRRARRRAAQSNAARSAGQSPMGATGAAGAAPVTPFAGQYYTEPTVQPMTGYGAPPPDGFAQEALNAVGDQTAPTTVAPLSADERPTLYGRPTSGSGSLT